MGSRLSMSVNMSVDADEEAPTQSPGVIKAEAAKSRLKKYAKNESVENLVSSGLCASGGHTMN